MSVSSNRYKDLDEKQLSQHLLKAQTYNDVASLLQLKADPNYQDFDNGDGKTLLHTCDNEDIVVLLLRYGAAINLRDFEGKTPLHYCRKRIFLQLIRSKADINIRDKYGNTPLYYNDFRFGTATLLKAKADPLIVNHSSYSPLFYLTNSESLQLLINSGIKLYYSVGKKLMPPEHRQYGTLLHRLCLLSSRDPSLSGPILSMLQQRVSYNVYDHQHRTPLMLLPACPVTEYILQHKGDINAQSKSGRTALHYAVMSDKPCLGCIRMLVNRGADPTIHDEYQLSPMHYAARTSNHIVQSLIDSIPPRLLATALNIRAGDDRHGVTPISFAATPEIAQTLLKAKASSAMKDTMHYFSPLSCHTNPDTISMLLRYYSPPDSRSKDNLSVLYGYVSYNRIKVLLSHGVRLDLLHRTLKSTYLEWLLHTGIGAIMLSQVNFKTSYDEDYTHPDDVCDDYSPARTIFTDPVKSVLHMPLKDQIRTNLTDYKSIIQMLIDHKAPLKTYTDTHILARNHHPDIIELLYHNKAHHDLDLSLYTTLTLGDVIIDPIERSNYTDSQLSRIISISYAEPHVIANSNDNCIKSVYQYKPIKQSDVFSRPGDLPPLIYWSMKGEDAIVHWLFKNKHCSVHDTCYVKGLKVTALHLASTPQVVQLLVGAKADLSSPTSTVLHSIDSHEAAVEYISHGGMIDVTFEPTSIDPLRITTDDENDSNGNSDEDDDDDDYYDDNDDDDADTLDDDYPLSIKKSDKSPVISHELPHISPLSRCHTRLLLALNADPNKCDTCLHPLLTAKDDSIAEMLLCAKADPNKAMVDNIPLVATNRSPTLLKLLLSAHADVNIPNLDPPILHWHSQLVIIKQLVAAKADINAIDSNGQSVLFHHNKLDVLLYLFDKNVNPHIRDHDGYTCLDFCQDDSIKSLLRDYMARYDMLRQNLMTRSWAHVQGGCPTSSNSSSRSTATSISSNSSSRKQTAPSALTCDITPIQGGIDTTITATASNKNNYTEYDNNDDTTLCEIINNSGSNYKPSHDTHHDSTHYDSNRVSDHNKDNNSTDTHDHPVLIKPTPVIIPRPPTKDRELPTLPPNHVIRPSSVVLPSLPRNTIATTSDTSHPASSPETPESRPQPPSASLPTASLPVLPKLIIKSVPEEFASPSSSAHLPVVTPTIVPSTSPLPSTPTPPPSSSSSTPTPPPSSSSTPTPPPSSSSSSADTTSTVSPSDTTSTVSPSDTTSTVSPSVYPLHTTTDVLTALSLIKSKCDPNSIDYTGSTALHYAKTPAMAKLLLNAKAQSNIQNVYGESPLHKAVEANMMNIVVMLINANADILLPTYRGKTPLHYSTNQDVTRYLIENNADPFIEDHDGNTPLFEF